MGQPMAQRLLAAGFDVVAYNRTATKVAPLVAAGATAVTSPVELVRACEVIVLMLTNAAAIHETLLTEDVHPLLAGKTIIQMGTIAPSDSRTLHKALSDLGGSYFEAPVLGSIPEAKAGRLIVMVGSTSEQFDQWRSLLQAFGSEPKYIGTVGTAAAVKLALNQLIGSLTTAFATSLSFVQQQGVDVDSFMGILRTSALYAPTFDKKLDRMVNRHYANPNFPTKHLQKDMNLFQTEAANLRIETSLVQAVQTVLQQAISLGYADSDYSALFSAIVPEERDD